MDTLGIVRQSSDFRVPPKHKVIDYRCLGEVIHNGPGQLHSVLIANGGCCTFTLRDNKRSVFRMAPAFSGSFYLELGFVDCLLIDVSGEMAAHLVISYREAKK